MAGNIFSNPSFESGTLGETPSGWISEYPNFVKSSDTAYDGSYSAKSEGTRLTKMHQFVDVTGIDFIRVYAKTTGATTATD